MDAADVEKIVADGLEGSTCTATDLTGTADHWRLEVRWSGFEGLSLLEQHRAVMEVVRPHMEEGNGSIHAVQIKTVK